MFIARRENKFLLKESIDFKLQVLTIEQLGVRVACLNAVLRSLLRPCTRYRISKPPAFKSENPNTLELH